MPKFSPLKPFELYTYNENYGNPSKLSSFYSDLVKTHIDIGGVLVNCYRMKGTFVQDRNALNIVNNQFGPSEQPNDVLSFLGIQDTVLNENRDREYDFDEIPILRGVYQVSQNELEYARFGLNFSNDILTMEFHTVTLERELGRRLIVGDVIEMPHLREVTIDGRVSNKWYEVTSVTWSPQSYDPTYGRHVLGCILRPMRHQQEFLDLFNRKDQYGKTLEEQASDKATMTRITEINQQIANEQASTTWFDTSNLYYDPNDMNKKPDRFTDDLKPINGLPVDKGTSFPTNAKENDWYIRTDFYPNKLYQMQKGRWRLKEIDRKRDWQPYNWVEPLREFLSDRSEEDRKRNYELRSIHDVLTEREYRSDPIGDEIEKYRKK